MVVAWGLLLKKSFTEEETLKPNIPIPEFDDRYKQKQTNFSKANLLKTNCLWPVSREANGHPRHPVASAPAD